MNRLAVPVAVALALLVPAAAAAAQQNPTVRRALEAYRDLNYSQAIALANRALEERMGSADQAQAYEILGFAYASTDSAVAAVNAFKQAILLNPDRDLDPTRVSPKITTAFSLALTQVLVVRHLDVDTTEFVAGVDALAIRFQVTKRARVKTRVVGGGAEAVVDSSLIDGTVNLRWNGLLAGGKAPQAGTYRVIVEAAAGRDSYEASFPMRIAPGAVDTLPHLTSLPGYEPLPETVVPERSWRPMGLAFLYTAVVAGGSLALENPNVGTGSRREVLAISAGALLAGLFTTLKKPAPVPAEANILYNRLLREQLARRNADIARENETRRQQVKLTVTPEPPPRPGAGGGS